MEKRQRYAAEIVKTHAITTAVGIGRGVINLRSLGGVQITASTDKPARGHNVSSSGGAGGFVVEVVGVRNCSRIAWGGKCLLSG